MKQTLRLFLPFGIGIGVAALLHFTIHWWGFWIIFPWIGFSVSTGITLRRFLKGKNRIIGRRVAILMVLPCMLLFIPIINNENFQLEGVALIMMVGFLAKGFIHYAIAKIFGPLVWGRGFCGWACWTAAILEWLPIRGSKKSFDPRYRNLRFLALALSIGIPAVMIFALNYNVWDNYINNQEMIWMFAGNAVYYLLGIPLAFIFKDRRMFCKVICPVSLVMIPTSSISIIKIKPKENECIECGRCNKACPMDIDVMSYIKNKKPVTHPECILCTDCRLACPVKAI